MDMILNGVGPNANIETQVDPTHQAVRMSIRPAEHVVLGNIGGHFYLAANFTTTAGKPSAGSQLVSVRWADTVKLFVPLRIGLTLMNTTLGTAQGYDFDVIAARSFTAQASGGQAIALSAQAQKARSQNMSGSLFASGGGIMLSSGDALTAGTQVLDTQPFGYAMSTVAAAGGGGNIPLYQMQDFGQHPLVFAASEGFVVRSGIAAPASAVNKIGFVMEWFETAAL